MKPRLNATRAVRELIKAHEPFVDMAQRRGRRWVIGWGHRATAREGATITPDNAELLLIYDALQAQQAVDAVVGTELPKTARDALASFAASIGLSAFKVSDVGRLAKAGRYREAAAALDSWVRTEVDGRLTVSERLVERRHAEKTLFLEALSEPVEAPDVPEDEPMLGVLVDVDIAFEDEPAAVTAPVAAPEPQAAPVPAPTTERKRAPLDDATADAEARAAIEATEREAAPAPAPAPTPTPEPEPEAVAEPDTSAELVEAPAEDAETETSAEPQADHKSSQDAAIKAVMSRMAGDIATSVVPAPFAEPEVESEAEAEAETASEPVPAEDLTDVRLGFSYMEPSRVEVPVPSREEAPAAEAASEPEPQPEPEPEPETKPDPATTPVYATVSVQSVPVQSTAIPAPSASAPPHPAAAPASAPGLSGESEGPDHPEDDDAYFGEDEDVLDPAIVAGPEAGDLEFEPEPQKSGSWVFPAMLGVGVVMTGLGAWELVSNWQAYLATGPGYSPIGPVVFGSGLLLSVGAGWMTLSRR